MKIKVNAGKNISGAVPLITNLYDQCGMLSQFSPYYC